MEFTSRFAWVICLQSCLSAVYTKSEKRVEKNKKEYFVAQRNKIAKVERIKKKKFYISLNKTATLRRVGEAA